MFWFFFLYEFNNVKVKGNNFQEIEAFNITSDVAVK